MNYVGKIIFGPAYYISFQAAYTHYHQNVPYLKKGSTEK